MASEHHDIDVTPIPNDQKAIFINEPWLVDKYLFDFGSRSKEPEAEPDNVRVYVPLDLNSRAILRRLGSVINKYKEANEDNELNFSAEVELLISQIEIYDQIRFIRNMPKEGNHSDEAKELVKKFVEVLESIPDGCAERFPFETIDRLKDEYLL